MAACVCERELNGERRKIIFVLMRKNECEMK